MKATIILIMILILNNIVLSQEDNSYAVLNPKYIQVGTGISAINLNGNIREFASFGGSLDLQGIQCWKNNAIAGTLNIAGAKQIKNFSQVSGVQSSSSLTSITSFGLHYKRMWTDKTWESYFYTMAGINYTILGDGSGSNVSTELDGWSPGIEIGRSIKIGAKNTTHILITDYHDFSKKDKAEFNPEYSVKFIEIYVGYRALLIRNDVAGGGYYYLGIRFNAHRYPSGKSIKLKN